MPDSELFVSINNHTERQMATNIFNGHHYHWSKGTRPNANLHERVIGPRTEIAELSRMSSPRTTSYHLGLTISDGNYLELTINHAVKAADASALTGALANEVCSVSSRVNKYRVERTVTGVKPLHLNIDIYELERDVNAQFIQQEVFNQTPADLQDTLQHQEVYEQSPTVPQSPIRQVDIHQIPGVPKSPIQHEIFDQNTTGPLSPMQQEMFDPSMSFHQNDIQEETLDQNPIVPLQHTSFEQNPTFDKLEIHHETVGQCPTVPQSPIRHEIIDETAMAPQSPIQKEIVDQTVLQTDQNFDDQNSTRKVELNWEEILENIIIITERFIQMEIIEECKNYVQLIVNYEDFDQISQDTQEMTF